MYGLSVLFTCVQHKCIAEFTFHTLFNLKPFALDLHITKTLQKTAHCLEADLLLAGRFGIWGRGFAFNYNTNRQRIKQFYN